MKRVWFGLVLGLCLCGQEPPAATLPENSVVLVVGMYGGTTHQGSGVVVAPGIVATNAHVVSGASTAVIRKGTERWYVREFCVEPDRDLCLMTVPGLTVTPALAGVPGEMAPGSAVLSIGFPNGVMQVRSGRLIAGWSFRGSRLLQSDAPIAPGSSGGGLFSQDGKLLGITTFIYGGNGKVNFSIPIDWIGRLQKGGVIRAELICPGMARDNITQEFFEHITEDPANWDSWDALSRSWIQEAPEDPNAWFARGLALSLRLRKETQQPEATVDPKLLKETLVVYQRAVQLGPRLSKTWNNLGVALDNLSRFEEARKAFRQAIQLKPDDALPWLNLGSNYSSDRMYREALEPFRKGLALEPDNALGWSRLAYCESSVGQWTDAVRDYRIALRLCPVRLDWWTDLYQACLKVQDVPGAESALERLRILDPDLARKLEVPNRKH